MNPFKEHLLWLPIYSETPISLFSVQNEENPLPIAYAIISGRMQIHFIILKGMFLFTYVLKMVIIKHKTMDIKP